LPGEIEEAAWERGQALREQSRAFEEWLQKAVQTLHRMTAQLENLPGTAESNRRRIAHRCAQANRARGGGYGTLTNADF